MEDSIMFEGDGTVHVAASKGRLGELEKLMKQSQGLELETKNYLGCTPLRCAATAGHLDCIQFLLGLGADVNAVDRKGQTPLLVAVMNGHRKCVECLLEHGADPDGSELCLCSPVFVAASDGRHDILELLVASGANVNKPQIIVGNLVTNPLFAAVKDYPRCARLLLSYGADPSYENIRRQQNGLPLLRPRIPCQGKLVDPVLLQMLYNAGLSDNVFFGNSKEVHGSAVVLNLLYAKPKSLQSMCRNVIRRKLGSKLLQAKITQLPIPSTLQDFLLFHASNV